MPMLLDVARDRAFGAIERIEGELAKLSDALLKEPETGHQEKKAVRRIGSVLRRHGIQIETGIAGLPTAFRAEIPGSSKGAPCVGILAEYDALSGIGHGCGHNLIAASAVGAAVGLKEALREMKGRAILFGTPAEEAGAEPGGGKVIMAEGGVFDELDCALMYHPYFQNAIDAAANAMVGLVFEFKGRSAHAAVDPWNGRNALDGVLLTYTNINALRQHVREDVRIHGIVTEGGHAPNIVPNRAAARFFVRSGLLRDLLAVRKRVEQCARAAALATGTKLTIREFSPPYADLKFNPPLSARLEEHIRSFGLKVGPPHMSKGSTDFGNVSQVCPAASFHLAITSRKIPWHSQEVVQAAGTKRAHQMTVIAAKILAATALDFWADPSLRGEVRRVFIGANS